MSSALPIWALEPLGVGSGMVESLTSYARRLASQMLIPAARLVTAVSGIITAQSYSEAINGTEAGSAEISAGLRQWSGVVELEMLTFTPFRSGLHLKKDFRSERAWCPVCVADPELAYDQVVTAFARARRCPQHGALLQTTCPGCGKPHRPWALWADPRRCHHCGALLGNARAACDEVDLETAAVHAVVEWTQQIRQVEPLRVAATMRQVRGAMPLQRAAGLYGLSFSTVRNLESGGQRLQMDTLVQILTTTGLTMADLHRSDPVEAPVRPTGPRTVTPRLDIEPLRRIVRAELELPLGSRRSLRQLARDLEVSHITLRRHVPELDQLIAQRRGGSQERGLAA